MGLEYLRQSEVIREKIRALRAECRGVCPKKQYRLRQRILSLYADAASLKTTGEYLVSYYGGKNE